MVGPVTPYFIEIIDPVGVKSWDPSAWGHTPKSGVWAVGIWTDLRTEISVTDPDTVTFTIPALSPIARRITPYSSDVVVWRNNRVLTRCRIVRRRHVLKGESAEHNIVVTAVGYKKVVGSQILHKADMDDLYVEGLGLISAIDNDKIIEYDKASDRPSEQAKMPAVGKIGHIIETDEWSRVETKKVKKTKPGTKKTKITVTQKVWVGKGTSVPSTGEETRGKQSKVFKNLVSKVLAREAFVRADITPRITYDPADFKRPKVNNKYVDPKRIFDGSVGMTFSDAFEEIGGQEKGFDWWVSVDPAKGRYGGFKILAQCPRRVRDRRLSADISLGIDIVDYSEENEEYYSFVQGIAQIGEKRKTEKVRERKVKELTVKGSWEKSIRFANSDDDEIEDTSELAARTKAALGFHAHRAPLIKIKMVPQSWWDNQLRVGDVITLHLNRNGLFPALPASRTVRIVEVSFNSDGSGEEPYDVTVESEYLDKEGRLTPPPAYVRGGARALADAGSAPIGPITLSDTPPNQPVYQPRSTIHDWDPFWTNLPGAVLSTEETPDGDGILTIACNNVTYAPLGTAVKMLNAAPFEVEPGQEFAFEASGTTTGPFTMRVWWYFAATPAGAAPWGNTVDPSCVWGLYEIVVTEAGEFRIVSNITSAPDPDDPETDIYGVSAPIPPTGVPAGCAYGRILYEVTPTHAFQTTVSLTKVGLFRLIEGLWDSDSIDAVPYTRNNVLKADPSKSFAQTMRSIHSGTY